MVDFLIYSLAAGIVAFIIAFVAALMSKKKFEEALTASMFVLGAVIILPMLVDAVLPTNLSAMLPLQKLPTLIGLLFVMPGLGFLVSRLSSRRR